MGDHFAFKSILPQIKEKYKDTELVLAVCYPAVFKKETNIKLISIQDAKNSYGNLDRFDIYKFMLDRQWTRTLVDAFKEMYLN